MSSLTHAVLYVDHGHGDLHQAALAEVGQSGQTFRPLDTDAAGGSKLFCARVYAACFNHVLPDDVEAFAESLPWRHASGVLIIEWEHWYEPHVTHLGYSAAPTP